MITSRLRFVMRRVLAVPARSWPAGRQLVVRLGRRWQRRQPMAAGEGVAARSAAAASVGPRFDEVAFPIDLVYTWVDGADPEWVSSKDEVVQQLDLERRADDAHDPSRYVSHDELRYSLRSVAQFADFVRHIFIVTDGQVPSWLDVDHPRITVVAHRDIFPTPDHLPTFNSHAIECCLHRIKGLAEHYLYLNDDFLFGRPVRPEQFFHANGMTKFFLSPAVIGDGDPSNGAQSVDAAATNTRRLVSERFGRTVSQKFKHAPYPQRRSVLYEMEAALSDEFERTAASQVRSADDVPVPSSLFHYYAYLTGRAAPGSIKSRYVSFNEKRLERRLRVLQQKRNFDVVCVNDSFHGDAGERERRSRALKRFMQAYWPVQSPFER